MGNCLSTILVSGDDTPDRYKARWAAGGLADGLGAFEPQHSKYGTHGAAAVSSYATTADVGLGRGDQQFAFLHEKPAPLHLDRIDEDAAMQGAPAASPLKPMPMASLTPSARPAERQVQVQPKHWTKGDMIGQGAFGSVYLGMDNDTGQLIAVKQVHIAKGMHSKKLQEHLSSLEEEVHLLQQLEHPNIVRYLGTERTEDALNIFLEYVPGGSIADLVRKFNGFKESVIKVYTKQILVGLQYLHDNAIMHRDIKGANILVDRNGRVKLADFGASKKLENLVTLDGSKSVKGTPYWMAPEVINQGGHGREADIWSVACTVIEMATGSPPWSNYGSQVAAMFHIASSKGPPTLPEHLSAECKDFLYLCFNRAWRNRPPASRLLEHPFLADVPLPGAPVGLPPVLSASLVQHQQQQLMMSQQNQQQVAAGCEVQASHSQRSAVGPAGPAPEESEGLPFHTPSPLNPKLAAAQAGLAGGAARISMANSDFPTPSGEHGGPSPSVQPGGSRQGQVEGIEASARQSEAGAYRPTSPGKRSRTSLRASAPVFSGYAAMALAQQQSEPLTAPRPAMLRPSASGGRQASGDAGLRSSKESGSVQRGSTAAGSSKAEPEAAAQLRTSTASTGAQPNTGAAAAAVAAGPASGMDAAAGLYILQPEKQQQQADEEGGAAAETPAPQRRAVQDLIQFASDTPEAAATAAGLQQLAAGPTPGTADSGSSGNSAGFNPMEEPSWMQGGIAPLNGGVSPLLGPRAAATAAASAAGSAVVRDDAKEQQQMAESQHGTRPDGIAVHEQRQPGQPAAPTLQDEHWVWTNDDGDIDALPWDMDAWGNAGGDGEQQPGQACGPTDQEPVDQEQITSVLSRKAQLDVRKSMALFEKSLNVPASSRALLGLGDSPADSPANLITAVKPLSARGNASNLGTPPAPQRQQQQPSAMKGALAASVSSGGSCGEAAAPLPAGGKEAVWEQELSRELQQWRMKGSTASAFSSGSNRRMSVHGSPQKLVHGGSSGTGGSAAGQAF